MPPGSASTPLAALKAGKRYFLSDSQPCALDCLAFGYLACLGAFGYLALMLAPDVPRPWLRDTVQRIYGSSLCTFVHDMRAELFQEKELALLWTPPDTAAANGRPVLDLAGRFAKGVVLSMPSLGDELQFWLASWEHDDSPEASRMQQLRARFRPSPYAASWLEPPPFLAQ